MKLEKILLVDDEPDIQTIAELSLTEIGGWQVVLASRGEEALEIVATERPDLVILDVMMPGLDGPSTLGRLQAQPDTAGIPVIFMTAKAHKAEVERLRQLGARGVITKPFDPMALPDQIRGILTP